MATKTAPKKATRPEVLDAGVDFKPSKSLGEVELVDAEAAAARLAVRRATGGPVSLSPEGSQELLDKLSPEKGEKGERGKKAPKFAGPALGTLVRFTRAQNGDHPAQVFAAVVTGQHPATPAEDPALSEAEQAEAVAFDKRALDDRNLTKDGDVVRRRFPLPAAPETVDLHVFVPVVGAPVQFVERVPKDAKGEQDVSWAEAK